MFYPSTSLVPTEKEMGRSGPKSLISLVAVQGSNLWPADEEAVALLGWAMSNKETGAEKNCSKRVGGLSTNFWTCHTYIQTGTYFEGRSVRPRGASKGRRAASKRKSTVALRE